MVNEIDKNKKYFDKIKADGIFNTDDRFDSVDRQYCFIQDLGKYHKGAGGKSDKNIHKADYDEDGRAFTEYSENRPITRFRHQSQNDYVQIERVLV